ncbi:MAG: peptidoglycan DD-metalloendopeptidase family protein [Spirochaetes bacterium]|nr:peptidoglycan DD-metalloendopeptidase family protein [Spirochaetota bacterium]
MSNRDVILQISIAALFCIFIFPCTIYSQSEVRINYKTDEYHSHNNVTYDSYENYRADRDRYDHSKPTILRDKQRAPNTRSSRSCRQCPSYNPKKKHYITYTIRKGDTLTAIARKNQISISSLRSMNRITPLSILKKGMVLKIPVKQSLSVPLEKQMLSCTDKKKPSERPFFQWPIKSVIDYRHDGLNGVKSIGIIITGKPGATVHSSAPGTVKKIGRMRGFGNYIVISHPGRFSTVYSNLDIIMVSIGDSVPAGNAIGKINAAEKKIHFQIDQAGKPENPLQYLPKKI